MKKILFLSYLDGFPNPNIGGPNHIIYDILRYALGGEVDFDFVSFSSKIVSIKKCELQNLGSYLDTIKKLTEGLYYKNYIFRKIVSSDFYKSIHYFRKDFQIKYKLPASAYNIIHSHDSVGLCYAKNISNQKKIMTIHSNSLISSDFSCSLKSKKLARVFYDRLIKKEREAYRIADVITFPSIAVKDYYIKSIDYNNTKDIRIIYNGIDIDLINSIEKTNLKSFFNYNDQYDYKIINVSSHEPNKQVRLSLEVIKELVYSFNKKVLFINIGEGSETENLKNYVLKNALENNVVWLGKIENKRVISLMKTCNIFLHLPKEVVFDLVILEALACGLTVFTTNDGGNKEIIQNDVNGILLENLVPNMIAKKIISTEIIKISANSISSIGNFNASKMAKDYTNLYKELL